MAAAMRLASWARVASAGPAWWGMATPLIVVVRVSPAVMAPPTVAVGP